MISEKITGGNERMVMETEMETVRMHRVLSVKLNGFVLYLTRTDKQ